MMGENIFPQKETNAEIQNVLLDLDGVLYTGNTALPGASEAISYLKKNHIPYLFLTNTTTKSRKELSEFLNDLGIPAEEEKILNSPRAAGEYIRETGNPKTFFVIKKEIQDDLKEINLESNTPEAVLVGDIGKEWNYQILNEIFQKVKNGARLIALHKGKFWQTKEGLMLDIGAFVSGIEYATGIKAEIIGKPSGAFFNAALKMISAEASHTIMIGDDLNSDVGGAQAYGIRGVLVKTGKYRDGILKNSNIHPYAVWDNISSLISFFQAI
ncbi:TIGR01458 family HAD-type hydrolase [Leptospira interrogans]|uniref:TIGR01458 family HAD-type hydrolase n=1 Tax=Leptospira interrogans TaxID=173 RepID=UPI0003035E6D|nr:TIGR01458 family HAD-type hydrolase [Leptospira interrogans]